MPVVVLSITVFSIGVFRLSLGVRIIFLKIVDEAVDRVIVLLLLVLVLLLFFRVV